MSYLDDNPSEVKNAGYYRRMLKLKDAELSQLRADHDALMGAVKEMRQADNDFEPPAKFWEAWGKLSDIFWAIKGRGE